MIVTTGGPISVARRGLRSSLIEWFDVVGGWGGSTGDSQAVLCGFLVVLLREW